MIKKLFLNILFFFFELLYSFEDWRAYRLRKKKYLELKNDEKLIQGLISSNVWSMDNESVKVVLAKNRAKLKEYSLEKYYKE
jgi:hypothetical protein